MYAQLSQQPIIDSVQEALRKYDAELRDINKKVPRHPLLLNIQLTPVDLVRPRIGLQ